MCRNTEHIACCVCSRCGGRLADRKEKKTARTREGSAPQAPFTPADLAGVRFLRQKSKMWYKKASVSPRDHDIDRAFVGRSCVYVLIVSLTHQAVVAASSVALGTSFISTSGVSSFLLAAASASAAALASASNFSCFSNSLAALSCSAFISASFFSLSSSALFLSCSSKSSTLGRTSGISQSSKKRVPSLLPIMVT